MTLDHAHDIRVNAREDSFLRDLLTHLDELRLTLAGHELECRFARQLHPPTILAAQAEDHLSPPEAHDVSHAKQILFVGCTRHQKETRPRNERAIEVEESCPSRGLGFGVHQPLHSVISAASMRRVWGRSPGSG